MGPEQLIALTREALMVALLLAAPPLLSVFFVAALSATLQSVLKVRDRALGVVPKLFAAGVAVLLAAPWTIRRLTQFTELLLGGIGEVGQ